MTRVGAEHGYPSIQPISSYEASHSRQEAHLRRLKTAVLALAAAVGIGTAIFAINYGIEQANGLRDQHAVSAWTQETRAQLLGLSPLRENDQRFYEMVQVVASGNTLAERQIRELRKTPIDVTNYPSALPSGAQPAVIGSVAQGTRIEHVLAGASVILPTSHGQVRIEYGAAFCGSILGLVNPVDDQRPPIQPQEICVIDLNNLQRVK